MLIRLYKNNVLANLSMILVLISGTWAYINMPREHNPAVNFNWVQINTVFPGASAEDVERLVTIPLEDAIRKVRDIRFCTSNSQEGLSSILIRFRDIDYRVYDKRITDLRREVTNKTNNELPEQAETPDFFELTSASMLPAAMIIVSGVSDDGVLRRNAQNILEDLERIPSVETVGALGLRDPEIHVEFFPERLSSIGVTPAALADTVSAYYRDLAVGSVNQANQQWLIRLVGIGNDLKNLGKFPLKTASGQIPIESVARISVGRERPLDLVNYKGKPGVLLVVSKKANTSVLNLVKQLNDYIDNQNQISDKTGVELILVDDQTPRIRAALQIMENNAALGVVLVILTTWLFLGSRVSFFIGIGIPFTLTGTFLVLYSIGESLNISVLLGVVIALGMIVDDAVVIVEAIHYQMQRGAVYLAAVIQGLSEVATPVFTSVVTTIAAFLPLMLTPGVLGKFMFVIPLVVTIALAISLLEAFWILPVHMSRIKLQLGNQSDISRLRFRLTRAITLQYCQALTFVLHQPKKSLIAIILVFATAIGVMAGGLVRADFFADDPVRLFYINIEMPPTTPLHETMKIVNLLDLDVNKLIRKRDLRHTVSTAGAYFSDTGVASGEQYGAITVTLNPESEKIQSIDAIIETLRNNLINTPGPVNISFLRITGGPPITKPITIKVRGDDLLALRNAVSALGSLLRKIAGVQDITIDDIPGKLQLKMRLDGSAIKRAGLDPELVARTIGLIFDGEIVASTQDRGEKIEVRVQAKRESTSNIDTLLRQPITIPNGGEIELGQLVTVEKIYGQVSIKHHNFRRSITIEANIDKNTTDTIKVNRTIQKEWREIRAQFPGVDLDFSGVFEDILESVKTLTILFLFGMGLIYIILGTQFKSYWQPFLILTSIPMAFTGVIFGLLITRNPLSLYTLYGTVALAGIAVNAAIVLIVSANSRMQSGMTVVHATVFAARRRLIPILITTLTTIAGLFALATGLGGHSLIWGPVASAIVWGLGVSTLLTLFLIPLLYLIFMNADTRKNIWEVFDVLKLRLMLR